MDHRAIVAMLGGPTKLARALGVADKTPLHWGQRGIPAVYWHRVAQFPKAVSAGITPDVLFHTRPAAKTRAA